MVDPLMGHSRPEIESAGSRIFAAQYQQVIHIENLTIFLLYFQPETARIVARIS